MTTVDTQTVENTTTAMNVAVEPAAEVIEATQVVARSDYKENIVTVGRKRKASFYMLLVKRLLAADAHEKIVVVGVKEGCDKATKVVSMLVNWGYCEITRIETGYAPSLKITVQKGPKFQENFDAFQVEFEARKLQRETEKAAEEAEKVAQAPEVKTDAEEVAHE